MKKKIKKVLHNCAAWKKVFFDYIVVQSEIALSIGIIGSIFASDKSISFAYFFLPALLGIICILPGAVIFFKDDMTIKQILIQRVMEAIVLEVSIIGVAWWLLGDTLGRDGYLSIGISILVLDVLTYVLSYVMEQKEADTLNAKLKIDREKRHTIEKILREYLKRGEDN